MKSHRPNSPAGSHLGGECSSKAPIVIGILIVALVKLYAFWGELPRSLEPFDFDDPVPDMVMDTRGVVVEGLAEYSPLPAMHAGISP